MAGQALRRLPDGEPTENTDTKGGLKRQAPESTALLKEAEQKLKEQPRKESTEQKKRRILERCGCL